MSKRDLAGTANYPFCTIEPNLARVEVPDERFTWLCQLFKPKSEVPATLSVTDIAGLVRGACKGEGLGNEFLSNIRAVNGIYQVVRLFEDEDVVHVEGKVDPVRDLQIISEELKQKDIEWMTKLQADLQKKMVCEPRKYKDEFALCNKVLDFLNNDPRPIRAGDWTQVEIEYIEGLNILTSKPTIYLLNMDEKSYLTKKNKFLGPVAQWIKNFSGEPIIPFSAVFERELEEMGPELAEKTLKEKNTKSSIGRIITTGYHDLGLINFFTCGADEVRGWTVRDGATAPIAGGVIHSDFLDYFIKAQVYHYHDLHELGSETAVKSAGKMRIEGKNYVVQDGDIIFFQHGSGGGKKK
ncbi:GTP-binding protein YchF containing protein [Tritrichomonas foetus]|uniref:Obg-like ATPase homolog n=1 Tax=Tritrichomonas foetus TaxID=1144522 RepID=A0A1J4JV25_9EUKA|nr:GTP-binding protein YchF containing protein [Tritrichomonas foetus]|eukprot:OHT01109.1 GTP-binding protein YchF containing protein [Tritrichomonas foetus]